MRQLPVSRIPWGHPQDVDPSPMRLPRESPPLQTSGPLISGGQTQGATGGFFSPSDPQQSQPLAPTDAEISIPNPIKANIKDAHRYAFLTGLTVLPTTTSQKFLDQPVGLRNMLLLRNNETAGGANFYVEFGKNATTTTTLRLEPGQSVLFDTVVPQDDLYVIADAAVTAPLSYSYSNIANPF